jgi:acylphosphatase
MHTVRVRIQGRVQGVGYRYWLERMAGDLGLSGWVRNRADGSVEAVLAGARANVEAMVASCQHGPRSAVVASVDVADEPESPAPGFKVLPTG